MSTPLLNAFLGGMMIGAASSLLLWLNGRIAGNSGIIGQCFAFKSGGYWRLAYVLGLLAGGFIHQIIFPGQLVLTYNSSVVGLIVAGLLVGFGTRMSGGCTSGHGVCGVARFSPRSLIATVIFVVTAILTVWIVRQGGMVWW